MRTVSYGWTHRQTRAREFPDRVMDEVARAVRWQRISPPRGVADTGRVLVSGARLADTWTYGKDRDPGAEKML